MQNWKLSMTMKVVFGLSVVLCVLVGITAFSIRNILEAQEYVGRVTSDFNVRLAALEAQGELIRDVQIRVRNIVLLDDPKPMQDELNRLQAVRKIYDESETRLTELFPDEASKPLIEELVRLRAAAKPRTDEAISLGLRNRNVEATNILLNEVSQNIEQRLRVLQKLIAQQQEGARQTAIAAAAAHDRATVLTVSIGVLAILLSACIGVVLLLFARGMDAEAVVPGRDMT